MRLEDYKSLQMELEEMTTTELISSAYSAISGLCTSGGRSFTMSAPPQAEDTDHLLREVVRRLEEFNAVK